VPADRQLQVPQHSQIDTSFHAAWCISIVAQQEQVGQLEGALCCAVALQNRHTLTFLTGLCSQHWAALCLCCHYNLTTFNDIQTANTSGTIDVEKLQLKLATSTTWMPSQYGKSIESLVCSVAVLCLFFSLSACKLYPTHIYCRQFRLRGMTAMLCRETRGRVCVVCLDMLQSGACLEFPSWYAFWW